MSGPADGAGKPRLVGVNHVALEVGDLDAALAFYGAIFAFTLRGRADGMAFLDMGDQFLALAETPAAATRPGDFRPEGHLGLVVDDRSRAKALARLRAHASSKGRSSTSSTPGAIGSRWSTTPTSSSPRHPKC